MPPEENGDETLWLEKRLDDLERRLSSILETLEKFQSKPVTEANLSTIESLTEQVTTLQAKITDLESKLEAAKTPEPEPKPTPIQQPPNDPGVEDDAPVPVVEKPPTLKYRRL